MPAKKRKFQVCNGYLLEFEQLARVLHYMADRAGVGGGRITRVELAEGTGLADRQLESLVSVGTALGLIQRGKQVLSDAGGVIVKHDIFLEMKGTLEWCHFQGAGSFRNLIWFEIFNSLLPNERAMSQEGWMAFLRDALARQYTDRTIGKHLREEVRFVVDAYLDRNFKKLEFLYRDSKGLLHRRRYLNPDFRVLTAILYEYADKQETKLLQLHDLAFSPGGPGVVFALDESTLRQLVENLHESGWVRYESRHDLDQVRLRDEFSPLDFLSAYYDGREPVALEDSGDGKEQGELML